MQYSLPVKGGSVLIAAQCRASADLHCAALACTYINQPEWTMNVDPPLWTSSHLSLTYGRRRHSSSVVLYRHEVSTAIVTSQRSLLIEYLASSNGAPQVYAPSPQPPAYAPHFDYSVPNEPAYPPLRPTNSSPNPTAPPGYQKEVHIGVDYRDVVRTPSPTPSENEALSKKMRSCAPDIKRYLNKEWLSQPRNISTSPSHSMPRWCGRSDWILNFDSPAGGVCRCDWPLDHVRRHAAEDRRGTRAPS